MLPLGWVDVTMALAVGLDVDFENNVDCIENFRQTALIVSNLARPYMLWMLIYRSTLRRESREHSSPAVLSNCSRSNMYF